MIFTLFLLIKNYLYNIAHLIKKGASSGIKNQPFETKSLKFLIPGIRIRLLLLFIASAIVLHLILKKQIINNIYT